MPARPRGIAEPQHGNVLARRNVACMPVIVEPEETERICQKMKSITRFALETMQSRTEVVRPNMPRYRRYPRSRYMYPTNSDK